MDNLVLMTSVATNSKLAYVKDFVARTLLAYSSWGLLRVFWTIGRIVGRRLLVFGGFYYKPAGRLCFTIVGYLLLLKVGLMLREGMS